jgi:hypothetical protein
MVHDEEEIEDDDESEETDDAEAEVHVRVGGEDFVLVPSSLSEARAKRAEPSEDLSHSSTEIRVQHEPRRSFAGRCDKRP